MHSGSPWPMSRKPAENCHKKVNETEKEKPKTRHKPSKALGGRGMVQQLADPQLWSHKRAEARSEDLGRGSSSEQNVFVHEWRSVSRFYDIYISQGSGATHLRWGGILHVTDHAASLYLDLQLGFLHQQPFKTYHHHHHHHHHHPVSTAVLKLNFRTGRIRR